MKHWNKQIYTCLKLWVVLISMTITSMTYANPDDPLEQLLRQRQQSQNQDDALENLIRSKTQSTVTPIRVPATPPVSVSRPQTMSVVGHTADNNTIGRGDADALLSNAMGLLGVAYRFGGTSPTSGFDCSGFMQHIFRKAFAVNLPRTAAEQARVGSYVSRSSLQPGDMVFFRTSGRRISHVGMYVGNDRFIHAPRTGKRIEITNLSNKYWSARYAAARRVKRQGADNFIR